MAAHEIRIALVCSGISFVRKVQFHQIQNGYSLNKSLWQQNRFVNFEGTKTLDGCNICQPTVSQLALKVENGESICKRVTKKVNQFRLNRILLIPTGGNGVRAGTRANVATNFTGPKKLLCDYHTLTLQHVQAWAAYNWGANDNPRVEPPTAMELKRLILQLQHHWNGPS